MNARHCPPACPGRLLDRKPERLVVTGLRCCMAGYDFGDIHCWETAWQSYCEELGSDEARKLMGELQFWVRTLRAESQRPLELYPHGCSHVCRDECMALSVIAALQDEDATTAGVAMNYLCGSPAEPARTSLLSAARGYAGLLRNAGQKLLSVPLGVVLSIACHDKARPAGASVH